MFRLGAEKTPARIEMDIDIELLPSSILLYISPMYSYDISNLAHYWTIFKPLCIDHDNGMLKMLLLLKIFIICRMQGSINNFQRADPLILGIAWVACIDNNTIDIHLITFVSLKV